MQGMFISLVEGHAQDQIAALWPHCLSHLVCDHLSYLCLPWEPKEQKVFCPEPVSSATSISYGPEGGKISRTWSFFWIGLSLFCCDKYLGRGPLGACLDKGPESPVYKPDGLPSTQGRSHTLNCPQGGGWGWKVWVGASSFPSTLFLAFMILTVPYSILCLRMSAGSG